MASWKNFERKVAEEIANQWGFKYKEEVIRTPCSGGMKNFKGDVIVIGKEFPFHLEAKFGYDFVLEDIVKDKKNIKAFIKQAEEDSPENKIPVVIASQPYYGRYVIIRKSRVIPEKIDFSVLSFFMLTTNYLVILLADLKKTYDMGVFNSV